MNLTFDYKRLKLDRINKPIHDPNSFLCSILVSSGSRSQSRDHDHICDLSTTGPEGVSMTVLRPAQQNHHNGPKRLFFQQVIIIYNQRSTQFFNTTLGTPQQQYTFLHEVSCFINI